MFNRYFIDSKQIAIITDKEDDISYSDIEIFISEIGKKLNTRSLLFSLCENETGSLLGYISFLEHKVVPVMLDATKDNDSILNLACLYSPNYFWMPEHKYSEKYGEIIFSSYNYVLVEYSTKKVEMCDDLALLLTTSGSTGSPKLVKLTYKNILSNAESIAEYLNITSDERPITLLPLHYSYGLSVINSHLIKGATILLTNATIMQKEFWSFAKEYKATSIAGVPYTYEMLRRLRIFKMDLPYLKTMTQAGGKLNPIFVKEYIEQAQASDNKFIVMYGQTEATARMSYLPFAVALERYSSIGIAIPGGKFSIIDKGGEEVLESNVDGQLVYSGANVSLGYAECQDDLSKGDENNGILYTGDIARRDEDGYYYITGRLKRFVKVFGNRVNLDATEQLVKTITTSCACTGIDDKITIFTTDEDKEAEIRTYLSKKLGLHITAFAVKTIENIPKNSSGKIQYSELNKLL